MKNKKYLLSLISNKGKTPEQMVEETIKHLKKKGILKEDFPKKK